MDCIAQTKKMDLVTGGIVKLQIFFVGNVDTNSIFFIGIFF